MNGKLQETLETTVIVVLALAIVLLSGGCGQKQFKTKPYIVKPVATQPAITPIAAETTAAAKDLPQAASDARDEAAALTPANVELKLTGLLEKLDFVAITAAQVYANAQATEAAAKVKDAEVKQLRDKGVKDEAAIADAHKQLALANAEIKRIADDNLRKALTVGGVLGLFVTGAAIAAAIRIPGFGGIGSTIAIASGIGSALCFAGILYRNEIAIIGGGIAIAGLVALLVAVWRKWGSIATNAVESVQASGGVKNVEIARAYQDDATAAFVDKVQHNLRVKAARKKASGAAQASTPPAPTPVSNINIGGGVQ